MKRSLLVCSILVLIGSLALAHPPSAINASYDSVSQILTVVVSHQVKNPDEHYIKGIKISQNGKDLLAQSFTRQFDDQKQLVKALLPKLSGTINLEIKGECSKFGVKEETIQLIIPDYTDVTPAQAQVLIEEIADLQIIDVSPHYKEGHLPGAQHYYLPNLKGRLNELSKDKTYLVYCHADGPSRSGAQTLADHGYSKVYRLQGNYSGWVNAGYRVEK